MANERALQNSPDAQFRFAMSEDGMKLGVSRYFPPNGGKGPSVELIKKQVAAAGVRLPIDEEAAQKIIDAIQRDSEIRRIVLVRGKPAQEPQHASLMALGNLDFPVFPGDHFARKRPPLEAADGHTIDGRVLKPTEDFEPDDIEISMGDNVEFDPLVEAYVSQVWGMARFKDNVISVDPIPVISEDAIEVRGNLHHQDFKGRPLTPARVEKEMRDLGVVIDLNMDELDARIRQAAEIGMPVLDHPLVEGKHPVPGRDGWLEYLVSTREATGTEDESGRLDFRDRGAYPMVDPGQTIGRLHEPTAGQGGIDIYGKTIPASGGNPLTIHLGENVAVQEDGITYQAKAKGIMVMEKNILSVTDCLLVSGNVDMNTGNVKLEHGSVKILGSVQAGFQVSAPKHVIVAGSVESATVYAGGNVEVSGGILMPDGGSVTAEGDVIASYVTNARIDAGGDVHVSNEATNSTIHAGGRYFGIQGKGIIQGGEVVASKGVKVNEIGSDLGVATTVSITIDSAEDEELRQERLKVKKAIQKIDDALGAESPEEILKRTPPEKRPAVAEVLKHRITLVKRRKSISEQINQMALKRQEELAGIAVKVTRLIHPGSAVKFGAMTREFDKRTEASVLTWDEANRTIVSD